MKRTLKIIANSIYTLVILLVVAITVLFMGTKIDFFGYEVKVVQSGSMEPAIKTGGIVVIAPTKNYRVGDVVTYGRDTRGKIPVTHRIIEDAGRGYYVTKGDANQNTDPKTVAERNIIGKVVLSIPYLGYAIQFARTPLGFILLIGFPALVIILDEFANITWEIHKYRYKRRRQGKVGYRTPSRERQPRDQTQPSPASKPVRPSPALGASPHSTAVLDLKALSSVNKRYI